MSLVWTLHIKSSREASWLRPLSAAFTRSEGGNPYLAASSDFIPRNPAPVTSSSSQKREKTLSEGDKECNTLQSIVLIHWTPLGLSTAEIQSGL